MQVKPYDINTLADIDAVAAEVPLNWGTYERQWIGEARPEWAVCAETEDGDYVITMIDGATYVALGGIAIADITDWASLTALEAPGEVIDYGRWLGRLASGRGVIDIEVDGPNTHPRVDAAKAAALAVAEACLGKDACTVYLAMMVYPEGTPQWEEATARWQAATAAAEVAFWGALDTYPHYGGITIVVD